MRRVLVREGFYMTLMPCFGALQAPAEGMLIGRILAGYGELELVMCQCVIAVEGQIHTPIKQIFGMTGAAQRIKVVKKEITNDYTNAGLQIEFAEALDDMEWCRKLRNQYAHCQWYWTSNEGLCFVNLEELAKNSDLITELTTNKHSINISLLQAQENYCNYVKECFSHLAGAYRAWDMMRSKPRRQTYVFPKPSKPERPLWYN